MTKKELVRAAVRGERPEHLPYAFWTHLPGIDLDPERLAEETYAFYRAYDIDFIKTMNNGMYPIEDFGCTVDYSEIPKGGVAKLVSTPIKTPEDWYKLTPCPVTEGSYGRELKSLSLLLEKVKGEEVPVIFTVFSPFTIANKICGGKLCEHIASGHGEAVRHALEVITETTAALTEKVIAMGADGVFFAMQDSTYDKMTEAEYREYGVPYDYKVLAAAGGGWMNTLHAHGKNIMFSLLKDYPVQVFNWHAWETLPGVGEAAKLSGKCLMGGLNRMDITECRYNEIRHQIYECFRELGGCHQLLTPGCVIRYPLNKEMLEFVKTAKLEVEKSFKDGVK